PLFHGAGPGHDAVDRQAKLAGEDFVAGAQGRQDRGRPAVIDPPWVVARHATSSRKLRRSPTPGGLSVLLGGTRARAKPPGSPPQAASHGSLAPVLRGRPAGARARRGRCWRGWPRPAGRRWSPRLYRYPASPPAPRRAFARWTATSPARAAPAIQPAHPA